MAFVFDCADWSPTCGSLAAVAAAWLAAGGATLTVPPPPPPSPPPPPPPPLPDASAPVTMEHRLLVLTTPGYAGTDFLEAALRGYGAPYEVVRWDNASLPRPDLRALLWAPAADGASPSTARFSAVALYPALDATGHMLRAEVELLWDFQRRTGARVVKFAAWPSTIGFAPNLAGCSSDNSTARFSAGVTSATLGVSALRPTAALSLAGLYRCPGAKAQVLPTCGLFAADFSASGLTPACTPTPLLETPAGVVAATVKHADGRELMAFTFDCADWSTACAAVAHLAIGWAFQDIVPGARLAALTVQADDFFLGTLSTATGAAYRATVADLNGQISWHKTALPAIPGFVAGTSIKLELPFNGNGVLAAAKAAGASVSPLAVDDRGCSEMPEYAQLGCNCWQSGWQSCASPHQFCQRCTKDFPKPLGTGADRLPATLPASWPASQLTKDKLAAAVRANTGGVADAFFWSHHTFTHMNLDNATSYDAAHQLSLNAAMAGALLLDTRASYSRRCLVTPQISGLANGDALRAFSEQGVACATGDNTWRHLRNPDNPHHMLYTTADKNGFDGFAVLPRAATEIYYNCSTVAQQEALYNAIYQSYYGARSTIADITAREAARVVRSGLLALRLDPHMMHQANLRLEGNGSGARSLVTRWLDAVLGQFFAIAAWPVRSLRLDELHAAFVAREARDAARLSYRLTLGADGGVAALTVASGATGGARQPAAAVGAPLLTFAGGAVSAQTVAVPAGGSGAATATGLKWNRPPATTTATTASTTAGRRLLTASRRA